MRRRREEVVSRVQATVSARMKDEGISDTGAPVAHGREGQAG